MKRIKWIFLPLKGFEGSNRHISVWLSDDIFPQQHGAKIRERN